MSRLLLVSSLFTFFSFNSFSQPCNYEIRPSSVSHSCSIYHNQDLVADFVSSEGVELQRYFDKEVINAEVVYIRDMLQKDGSCEISTVTEAYLREVDFTDQSRAKGDPGLRLTVDTASISSECITTLKY